MSYLEQVNSLSVNWTGNCPHGNLSQSTQALHLFDFVNATIQDFCFLKTNLTQKQFPMHLSMSFAPERDSRHPVKGGKVCATQGLNPHPI